MALGTIIGSMAAKAIATRVKKAVRGPKKSTTSPSGLSLTPQGLQFAAPQGQMIPMGSDVDIVPSAEGQRYEYDESGELVRVDKPRRRRRRRLLTCQDKADIAFLRGTLGGGQLGTAAITSLLTSRCR